MYYKTLQSEVGLGRLCPHRGIAKFVNKAK